MRKIATGLAIIAPWAAGTWAYFNLGFPVWPWLLASCLVAVLVSPKALRTAMALAVAILAVQFAKHEFPAAHTWVYYAAIYTTVGVFSHAVWDKVAGRAALVIAVLFLIGFAGLPRDIVDAMTEMAVHVALIWAALNGHSDGIFTGFHRPTGAPENGGGAVVRGGVGVAGDIGVGGLNVADQRRMAGGVAPAGSDH